MRYGTIVEYFPDKKLGFIRLDSGQDVFVHISALDAGETQPEIKLGQPVKYELTPRREATPKARPADGKKRVADRDRPAQPRTKLVVLIDKILGATLAEFDASNQCTSSSTSPAQEADLEEMTGPYSICRVAASGTLGRQSRIPVTFKPSWRPC